MNKGKIKFYDSSKEFGFIVDDATKQDVFFHVTGLTFGFIPEKDQRVTFDIVQGKKGNKAVEVKPA